MESLMEPFRVVLMPGQAIVIEFFGTDGEVTVDFNSKGDYKLTVHTDMPDTQGREGEIYCEDFEPGRRCPACGTPYAEESINGGRCMGLTREGNLCATMIATYFHDKG